MSATEFKDKGNVALQQKDFKKAIELYTQGLNLDQNEVLFANRAAAHLALNSFADALSDAEKAISIKPAWSRGHMRKGQALHGLGRLNEAKDTLNKALQLEPENAQVKKALADVEAAIKEQASAPRGLFSPEVLMKLAMNPKIAKNFQDPAFMQKIQLMNSNPQLISTYAQDPQIMELMTELINMSGGGAFGKDTEMGEAEPPMQEPPKQETPKPKQEEPKPKQEEPPKSESTNPAEKEKQLGNEAYTKKKFADALEHYNKAVELDPNNATYRLNRAAVYLETSREDECIKECLEAIDIGKKSTPKADYTQIAKAYARIGSAYFKQQKYKDAIYYFTESLTEHRTREVQDKKTKAEQLLKKQEEDAYIDPAKAEEEKNLGNEAFKKQDYPTAVKHYREAIRRNPSNHIYYSNLASAYIKLGEFGYALKNYEKSIEIDPKFVKGYKGKALCHQFMKEYHKALEAFDQGLKLDPENQELKEGKANLIFLINSQTGPDEERLKRARQDPEIIAIMQDPIMQTVLQDLKDPKEAAKHFSNPEIRAKLEKLIAAGILQTK